MKEKVLKSIKENNLIENGDKIVCAVSGGPDSLAMLHCLKNIKDEGNLQFEIIVAHVNHMLREEADSEEEFVKKFCKDNQIKFYSKKANVEKIAKDEKISTEEAGRNVRYDFFEEVLKKVNGNKIAIAHNKNDKIETIIMNILRGTGIAGLKGIEIKREKYIRPILECEREEIEKYCEDNKLNPRIDKSNFENEYTRNKIRNIVIPYIKKEFNPNIISTVDRLSNLVKEEEEYFDVEVEKKYREISLEEKSGQIVLDLKKFNLFEKVIKGRIVLYTITRLFNTSKGIEKIHIEDIIKLCERNIGNKFLTPNKNLKVLVKNHKIFFISLV